MGRVVTGFSMSLDGFVAGPEDDVSRVFKWMSSGDTSLTTPMGEQEMELKVSEKSARIFQEASEQAGALLAGRRLFEITHGWGGRHPLDVPIVVLSHRPAPEWIKKEWPVTFVSDGIEGAIARAKAIAGEKTVTVASPTLVQQCLKAGLLDEIHIDLAPYLLGQGVRLFERLDAPMELECTRVVEATGVTHLTFRVVK